MEKKYQRVQQFVIGLRMLTLFCKFKEAMGRFIETTSTLPFFIVLSPDTQFLKSKGINEPISTQKIHDMHITRYTIPPNPLKWCEILKYMNISYYINHNMQRIKNGTLSSICSIFIYFLDQINKREFSGQDLLLIMKLLPESIKLSDGLDSESNGMNKIG